MSAILDIIGSIVFAGFVILMGLRVNATLSNSNDSLKADVNVQENLVSLVESIEYDFRKMGYGVLDPTQVIQRADSDHVTFLSDMSDDGTIDTVEWYVGPPLTATPNPNDIYLFRKVSGIGITTSVPGVTQFSLRYLNQDGLPAVTFGQIWIIETSLRVESPWKVQDPMVLDQSYENYGYSAAFWRQTRLASRNLKRHG